MAGVARLDSLEEGRDDRVAFALVPSEELKQILELEGCDCKTDVVEDASNAISEKDWHRPFEEFSMATGASALELQLASVSNKDFV